MTLSNISALPFPIYWKIISVIWISCFLACICSICQKIFEKLKDNHTSLFMKMFSPKKNLLKCFVAIQSLIQGFGKSIHFLISSRLVAGMLVLSSIWNYPVGRRKYFSLSSSASARVWVWVWGIINYSCAEVYLALQYRAIYHRNKCWDHLHHPPPAHTLPDLTYFLFFIHLVHQLVRMILIGE